MTITLTTGECRLIADIIKRRYAHEVAKLCTELALKVLDTNLDVDTVDIVTDPDTIVFIYPLLNQITGEIDPVRNTMKISLMNQIMTGMVAQDPEWMELAQKIGNIQSHFDSVLSGRIQSGKEFLESLR